MKTFELMNIGERLMFNTLALQTLWNILPYLLDEELLLLAEKLFYW